MPEADRKKQVQTLPPEKERELREAIRQIEERLKRAREVSEEYERKRKVEGGS